MSKTVNIPKGYKQSQLGLIPEEWEVKRLGELGEIKSGTTPSREKCFYYSEGTIPWVKTLDLNNGIVLATEEKVTNKAIEDTSLVLLPRGTILVAMYGGFNQIGRTGILGIEATINQAISGVVLGKEYDAAYTLQYLNLNVSRWRKYAASSRKDPNITGKDVFNFNLTIPPLPEQRKIAEVLSTWDKAIELQTAIIDKLTLRKKGLMQQLLTGKKRLKGFSDIYNLSSLKGLIDEVSVRNGKLEGIPVLSVTNTRGFVSQLEQFDKEVASEDNSNYKIVCKGQFAYNPSRINVGSIDILRTFERGLLSPMYVVFKVNERKLSADYLCQQLKSWWFIGHISNYVQGSVRDSLSFDGLCSMKFFIPSIKEQNAIAEILTSADREIEKEKQKLAALKQQKKGLMQQLLTGKKRVVV